MFKFFDKYNLFVKIAFAFFIFVIVVFAMLFIFITKGLPQIVSNPKFINYVQTTVKESFEADLVLKNLDLNTNALSKIKFNADLIEIKKNNEKYFALEKLDSEISITKILEHKIILKKLGADNLFADITKLSSLFGKEEKTQKKSDWKVRWFSSLLYLKQCQIIYSPNKNFGFNLVGKNIAITEEKNPKFAHFDIKTTVTGNGETFLLGFSDNNSVYIKDKVLHIDKGIINVNNSKLFVNATLDEKNKYSIKLNSKGFQLKNVVNVLNSNIVMPSGKEMLECFSDFNGDFNFDIDYNNDGLNGNIYIKDNSFKIIPLNNLPIKLSSGVINITPKNINISDVQGYYGNDTKNKISAKGSILDYTKNAKTDIVVFCLARNELTQKYLSKIVGYPLTLTGDSNTAAKIQTIDNKLNILWMFKLAKGNDILVDGTSFSPVDYDRVLTADMDINKNILNIKKINYYIASVIDKNSRGKIKPILTIDGNLDLAKNGEIQDIGFMIPKPLPSEFLNIFVGQKFFKNGTISGDLRMINSKNNPILSGKLALDKVLVPSQRLSIHNAQLTTTNSSINLSAKGRFKKSEYDFKGELKNSILFPIIVRNANLKIDNVDVNRILTSFNNQNTDSVTNIKEIETESKNENDDSYTFDTNLLIIENSELNVIKGNYKDLKFGNINAKMTLNKEGLLKLHSNRFDFAEGISTLNSVCDLKNHIYDIRLGVREVNSNLVSTNLLSLPGEIYGKAKGLIVLHTDESLKLNGDVKFEINNGQIGKIGLVQYILNVASLFRNPIVMINPSTVVDLVTVPEGKFDNISGELELKNNIAQRIMIKSTSPQLSTFIIGKYDLENNDAALRIYTKFSNKSRGVKGILKNVSLNGLANIIPFGNNNAKNYYEAELKLLPPIDADEDDCQVFLTTVDGDLTNNNFISSLKKIN